MQEERLFAERAKLEHGLIGAQRAEGEHRKKLEKKEQ